MKSNQTIATLLQHCGSTMMLLGVTRALQFLRRVLWCMQDLLIVRTVLAQNNIGYKTGRTRQMM